MTQHIRTSLMVALVCIALAGCGRTSPPSSYYILTGPDTLAQESSAASNMTSGATIGVGPITLPGHLDRSQIVTLTGQNTIKIHEYQRWGNTLQRQLEETLAKNLTVFLQTPRVTIYPWERALRPQYQVFLTVRKLEGELGKTITLDAIWQVVDVATDTSLLTENFTGTFPVTDTSMEAYVRAQSSALEALSSDIARGIQFVSSK